MGQHMRFIRIILFVLLAGLVVASSISFITVVSSNDRDDMLPIFLVSFAFTVMLIGVTFSIGGKENDNLQDMEDRISKINKEIYQLKKWHK
jgi:hypothetical protein